MNTQPLRILGLLLAIVCFAGSHPSARAGSTTQPNFIIIFCDDQGYQDLGCFGSPHIKTPNVDRLAREGIRFTDFYSAYCVCSASRASLLTGCYQPRISKASNVAESNPDRVARLRQVAEQYDTLLQENSRPAWTAKK